MTDVGFSHSMSSSLNSYLLRARISGRRSMCSKPASRIPRSRTEYTSARARDWGRSPHPRTLPEMGIPIARIFRLGQRFLGATHIYALEPRFHFCGWGLALGRPTNLGKPY